MKYLKVVLLAIFLGLSTSANAILIENNTFTTDTDTGLNWLDFSFTINKSRDYILTQFIDGGEFDGYRYATDMEVVNLWSNFGFDLSTIQPGTHGDASDGLIEASNLLGNTSNLFDPNSFDYGTIGVTENVSLSGANNYNVLGVYHTLPVNVTTHLSIQNPGYVDSSIVTAAGHYLIADTYPAVSTVPVPAAAWLFGSALLGFFGFSRRKAKA